MAADSKWPARRQHWAPIVALAVLLGGRAGAGQAACVETPRPRLPPPVLSLIGGRGGRGGTVPVTLVLERDSEERASSADIVIHFRRGLRFAPPLLARCKIAPRLAATHALGGGLLDSSRLSLSVFVQVFPVPPLGDGELATCELSVSQTASLGNSPLSAEDPLLADANGHCLRVTAHDGSVDIAAAVPTETPTATPPPPPDTATATVTAEPPDTATASATPSPTETASPRPPCIGDCGGDTAVTSDELIRAINISLLRSPLDSCAAADRNGDGAVDIGELISAVQVALHGCA